MARIAGVDLPKKKRIEYGLTYIYGIDLRREKFSMRQEFLTIKESPI